VLLASAPANYLCSGAISGDVNFVRLQGGWHMQARIATESDLVELSSFDDWREATRSRVEAGECVVSEDDNQVVAYALHDKSFLKEHFVPYIFVRPDNRHKGHGNVLLAGIEEILDGETLYISTGLPNLAMQGLLKKRGYRVTGMVDLEGYIEMIYVKNLETKCAKNVEVKHAGS